MGLKYMTKIQAAAIPELLQGRFDFLAFIIVFFSCDYFHKFF